MRQVLENSVADRNQQAISECEHVQMMGMAYYDDGRYITFCPDDPVPGSVPRFRLAGVAQQMSDGTFDFVASPRRRVQSKLIWKLPHGRASVTKDGAIQLTLKVFCYEGINISEAISSESYEAALAIRDYQLRH